MWFVTGASGQLGQLVAEEFARIAKPAEITLGTREPEKLARFAAQGFRIARFGFDDPAGMEAALKGHDRVLIISGNAPVEARILQHRAAIHAAKSAGVKRIVYTSFTNPSEASLFSFAKIHAATEADLAASGVQFIALRNNMYAENLAGAIAKAKETGTIALPGHQGKVAFVARADTAAAAAAALASADGTSRALEITGPDSWSLVEIAAELGKIWGKPVKADELPQEVFGQVLASFGLPPFVVEALQGIRAAAGKGEYAAVSQDFETLVGRKPESLPRALKRMA